MAFYSTLRIAASALTAQRLRADVIANNVANMNTTRTAEGGPYRRQQVVFQAQQAPLSFGAMLLAQRLGSFPGLAGRTLPSEAPGQGVAVVSVGPDGRPPKRVYEPDNPDAGPDGFVEYPDIDPITEMADMLSATRAYEANVTTLNAAKAMALKALEIGR